jgi:hypothetical protein
MEQEDYIKRQIDQLGYILGKILTHLFGLKTQGQITDGIGVVNPILKNELNLTVDELISIPAEKFIYTLAEYKNLNDENLGSLAEILIFLADELNSNGRDQEKMKRLYQKSLMIFEHIEETGSIYSYDRHLKIEKLKITLRQGEGSS